MCWSTNRPRSSSWSRSSGGKTRSSSRPRFEPRGPRFPVTVHLTEPLGDVTVIDLEAGGAILKMALPEEEALAYRHGAALTVELSVGDAHLFHRESGTALPSRAT